MALFDVFQFNYHVDIEIARNNMKNFAETLGKAFEEHKKLWNEYLKLRQYCEDAGVKIPFQLLEPDNCNVNAVIVPDTSRAPSENIKIPVPLRENVPNDTSLVLNPYVNENDKSESDNSKQKQKDKLLKSPILAEKHVKRKNLKTNDPKKDLKKKKSCSPLYIDENIPIVIDDIKESIKYNEKEGEENSVNDESNDRIEATPIFKRFRKLGVSKLYNVDTTLLSSGKKLRQSKIVLFPDKQSVNTTNNSMYNKSKCVKSRIPPIPEKNKEVNKSGFLEEEIIQCTPNKINKSQSKKGSSQLRRKLMDIKADDKSDKFTDKSNSYTKLPMSETNQFKHDQYPSTVRTSKQKIDSYNRSVERSNNIYLNSHVLSNTKNLVQEIKKENITQMEKEEMKEKIIQIERRKIKNEGEKYMFPNLSHQMLNDNSSQNDETLFSMEDEDIEKFNYDKSVLKTIENNEIERNIKKENITQIEEKEIKEEIINQMGKNEEEDRDKGMEEFKCKNNVSKAVKNNGTRQEISKSPPSKKSCPESVMYYDKVPRKQSERKKLIGITCWDCKKYYDGLGLSEEELAKKKNLCSRHRSYFPERSPTPEGFWDHLFPDTMSSTYAE